MSQEEEEEQQQKEQQKPSPKSISRGVNLTYKLLTGFWLSLGG